MKLTYHEERVIEHRIKYKNKWRNRSNLYWLWRLLQEVAELIGSLMRLHKHKPEVELYQIASICINWLEMRSNQT